jgi:hypothetical protein
MNPGGILLIFNWPELRQKFPTKRNSVETAVLSTAIKAIRRINQ